MIRGTDMSRNTSLALAALSAMVAGAVVGSHILAAERGPAVSDVGSDEFVGKIVDIQTITKRTFVLENVKVIQLGGRWFLSGTGIKNYCGFWWQGVPVRVSVSSVESYCPMSAQQYQTTTGKRADP